MMDDVYSKIQEHINSLTNSSFSVNTVKTKTVPYYDDSAITFDRLDDKSKGVKELNSCVLFIDIRDSTHLNQVLGAEVLTRLYSLFASSMIKAANYFGGQVRNIIGDRLMVVFDSENCAANAVRTAIFMNTISSRIIKPLVTSVEFKCGIGIDYGSMTVAKVGTHKRDAGDKDFYRSLVWLGRPANVASKLTDIANKDTGAILMTEEVFTNYALACPDDDSIKERFWYCSNAKVEVYQGNIVAGDVIFRR